MDFFQRGSGVDNVEIFDQSGLNGWWNEVADIEDFVGVLEELFFVMGIFPAE